MCAFEKATPLHISRDRQMRIRAGQLGRIQAGQVWTGAGREKLDPPRFHKFAANGFGGCFCRPGNTVQLNRGLWVFSSCRTCPHMTLLLPSINRRDRVNDGGYSDILQPMISGCTGAMRGNLSMWIHIYTLGVVVNGRRIQNGAITAT